MNILYISLFVLCILFIFILLFKLKNMFNLNLIIILFFSILIIQIILNPNLFIKSSLNGTKIFFKSVFTPIFPFLIISNILIQCNGVSIYSKLFGKILCRPFNLPEECSFPILISFISGYPLGAKYSCYLYKENIINYDTCSSMLNIASNASPLFLIGTIGASMLKNPKLGYILLLSNYLSCFIMALILKTNKTYEKTKSVNFNISSPINIGEVLNKSIQNSISTILSIGSFIIFFSILSSFIKENFIINKVINLTCNLFKIPFELFYSIFLGFIEVTNGAFQISSIKIPILYKLIILSFLVSFSGISIILQVYSIINKYNFSLKTYIARKLLQAIISSFITLLLFLIYSTNFLPVINFDVNFHILNFKILKFQLIILLLPILVYKLFNLFHVS